MIRYAVIIVSFSLNEDSRWIINPIIVEDDIDDIKEAEKLREWTLNNKVSIDPQNVQVISYKL